MTSHVYSPTGVACQPQRGIHASCTCAITSLFHLPPSPLPLLRDLRDLCETALRRARKPYIFHDRQRRGKNLSRGSRGSRRSAICETLILLCALCVFARDSPISRSPMRRLSGGRKHPTEYLSQRRQERQEEEEKEANAFCAWKRGAEVYWNPDVSLPRTKERIR